MSDEERRNLARELSTRLEEVIADEDERRTVAEELDAALAIEGAEGDARLVEVLRASPDAREWMGGREELEEVDRIVEPGGDVGEVGTYFVCPYGDSDYVRDHVGDPVPLCPEHHVPLSPARSDP